MQDLVALGCARDVRHWLGWAYRTKSKRMDKEEQRADGKMSWRLKGALFVRRETKVKVSKMEGYACGSYWDEGGEMLKGHACPEYLQLTTELMNPL